MEFIKKKKTVFNYNVFVRKKYYCFGLLRTVTR